MANTNMVTFFKDGKLAEFLNTVKNDDIIVGSTHACETKLAAANQKIDSLTSNKNEMSQDYLILQKKCESDDRKLEELRNYIFEKTRTIQSLTGELSNLQLQTAKDTKTLRLQTAKDTKLKNELAECKKNEKTLNEKKMEIKGWEESSERQSRDISRLRIESNNKTADINNMREAIKKLQIMKDRAEKEKEMLQKKLDEKKKVSI